jgi:hypothetical protein
MYLGASHVVFIVDLQLKPTQGDDGCPEAPPH